MYESFVLPVGLVWLRSAWPSLAEGRVATVRERTDSAVLTLSESARACVALGLTAPQSAESGMLSRDRSWLRRLRAGPRPISLTRDGIRLIQSSGGAAGRGGG